MAILILTTSATFFSASAESSDTLGIENYTYYYIKNLSTGRYLDVQGGPNEVNGNNVGNYNFNGNSNQKWLAVRNPNGSYSFKTSYNNNYALDVYGDNVDIWWYGSYPDDQSFFLERNNTYSYGGTYFMRNQGTSQYVTASGYDVVISYSNATTALWSFEKVSKGDADIYNFSEFVIGVSETWYRGKMNTMGYTPYYFINHPRNTAFSYLQFDSMWFHTGHGAPGSVGFTDGDITASNINALTNNELAGLRCFITLGCSSGATNSSGQNIIKSVYDKGGQFALGFTHKQWTPVAETWLIRFIDYSSNGNTVRASLQYADLVANLPYFGTGMKYYFGDYYQCLNR